jgi:hypothetical protein
MNKKAQIKMFETIAILVVFFMIIMFGFMFYTRVQKGSFEAEIEEATTLRAIETSQIITFLPELQCSRNNIAEKDCIDILKLQGAESIISANRQYYFTSFKYSNIYVQEIYPSENEFTLYDFPKEQFTDVISTQFPISLYNPITDKYSYGVLFVDIYK